MIGLIERYSGHTLQMPREVSECLLFSRSRHKKGNIYILFTFWTRLVGRSAPDYCGESRFGNYQLKNTLRRHLRNRDYCLDHAHESHISEVSSRFPICSRLRRKP